MAATHYLAAISLIDAAHAQDPNTHTSTNPATKSTTTIPYELHYARKMTHYLTAHSPILAASPILAVAIRAQHFRRWEVPRSSYPATRAGYLAWRAFLKKRQAEGVERVCVEAGFAEGEAKEVGRLVRKEGLGRSGGDGDGNGEMQVLEDVACLVFLDDQFEGFAFGDGGLDEDKVVGVLRKTWGKMSERGRELALQIPMSDACKELVGKALAG
ncbi:hypothetical protein LHYA1_G004229 [Lachnellula hyalina]|uniref:Glutamyl-tRNA synthetase n=1 Tax=Lachnellula hyalina TaxID=1316788 RepID=A0A8H8R5J1_9HELO|nr:uncharacterized protein LHYA1_G004229 [Lachnellula hyalina]TVY27244.1 hypothetical protein LHYA1_G004229 [Lachnellula hyalina]